MIKPKGIKTKWVKRPKGGGEETIFRNQYFFRKQFGGISLHTVDSLGNEEYIRHNDIPCVYCRLGFNDALIRFKITDKTRTKYSDWEVCKLGFCKRLKFKIANRDYWAKFDTTIKRFLIYNVHTGRKSIGTLPKYIIPKKFHRDFVF